MTKFIGCNKFKTFKMQTILGAGGSIATDLAKELAAHSKDIRLVSRNPKKVNETDELFVCDLTDGSKVLQAVEGSEIVYLTAGFPYKTKVWQHTWPLVMQNTIDACKKHHSKLVFIDNMYMYDPIKLSFMTEDTPIKPSSKKGKVRQEIAAMLMHEVKAGNLKALIARSADFYGPGINNSLLLEVVFKNLQKGKKANWFCSVDKKHSFTYTPDAAKAMAILGNDDKSYGQVWHLPTAKNPMTGKEWIEAFATEMNAGPGYMVIGKTMIKFMGLFSSIMKEFSEMLYQYDREYVFDSSKFEEAYDLKPTAYLEGIKVVVKAG